MKTEKRIEDIQNINGTTFLTIAIPTLKTGDYEKNRIRWKNAVAEARQQCEILGLDCEKALKQAEGYEGNKDFWANQGNGLVGYFTNESSEIVKLGQNVINLIDVNTTPNLYPLVSEQKTNSAMYVLCVSKNMTSLHLLSNGEISKIDISNNVVKDYDEAMNIDDEISSLQFHTVGGGDAHFHGNGPGQDNDNTRTMQYLRRVDDGIIEVIGKEGFPLVLACVDEYLPMYKEVSSYHDLHTENISGNPDDYTESELLEAANCVLKDLMGAKVKTFFEAWDSAKGSQLDFNQEDDLKTAATMKNVDRLLVNESRLNELESEEKNSLTRSIVQAYESGADVICISDPDSEEMVLGSHRFLMESSVS